MKKRTLFFSYLIVITALFIAVRAIRPLGFKSAPSKAVSPPEATLAQATVDQGDYSSRPVRPTMPIPSTAAAGPTLQPLIFGRNFPATLDRIPDGTFRAQLLAATPSAREKALGILTDLRVPIADTASLNIDALGLLFYACIGGHGAGDPAASESTANQPQKMQTRTASDANPSNVRTAKAASAPISQPPVRHSRPGSSHVLYLDFGGMTITGTAWNTSNQVPSWICLPYDTDGDRTTFNSDEQAAIIYVWERVAEDFIPFDIDVTTEAPVSFGANTAHVLITRPLDANNTQLPMSHMGGVAYLDIFGHSDFQRSLPAFVFYPNMGGAADIAEVVSHETGHLLGLSHDGTSHDEYYGGHGVLGDSWAPIMGVSYGRTITQWSKGEYYDANNPQDDVAIMTLKLGLATIPHGSSIATALPLNVTGALATYNGVISSASENDYFSFATGAGTVAISVDPFVSAVGMGGGNLHLGVELLGSGGAVIQSANSATSASATLTANLTAGTYYLHVFATGLGTPLVNPPSGYTSYDSRGRFTVTGTIVPTVPAVPLFTLQPQSTSANAGSTVKFSANAVGTLPLTYQWQKNGVAIAGESAASLTLYNLQTGDQANYTVVAQNSTGSTVSQTASLTVPPVVLTPARKEAGAGAVAYQILVETTGAWTVQTPADWVSLGNTSGVAARNLMVNLAANTTGQDRTTTIQIGGGVHTIMQHAAGGSSGELWSLGDDAYGELGQFHRIAPSALARNVRSVAATQNTTFYITDDGILWGLGLNGSGQLGDGSTTTRTQPVQIATGVASMCAGWTSTLFLKTDGTLWGMGDPLYTQAASFGARTTPTIPVQLTTNVRAIAAGLLHSLFLKTDGTLWGMGDDRYGQLGQGVTSSTPRGPVMISTNVTAIAAGDSHTLFIKTDGTLWATGANAGGNLGDGTTTDRTTPVKVADNVTNVWAAYYQSFFSTADRKFWAMGRDEIGQLGDGTRVDHATPVQVTTDVTVASGGWQHLGFIRSDGSLWIAGGGSGIDIEHAMLSPTEVASNVKTVAAAYHQTLYVTNDGTLWVVGNNDNGVLSDIALSSQSHPLEVALDVQAVVVGLDHSLFLKTDGTLWGMGRNGYCQLGDGTTIHRTGPVQIARAVRQMASGYDHVLFLGTDDSLWAMGYACAGELGDGANLNSHLWPVLVASGVRVAAGGAAHTLFVKTDGTLWGTGGNSNGELGNGTTTNLNTPVQIAANVLTVACGGWHSLFIQTDGTLWAMGMNNYGQLGDGTTVNRTHPVLVASGVQRVQACEYTTLFIKTDGTLWAMGSNAYGQLGDGTTTNRATPVQVASGVVDVAVGQYHAIYLKNDQTVWGMGMNHKGQLGVQPPSSNGLLYPTPVKLASGIKGIAAGGSHNLFIAASNSIANPVSPAISAQPTAQTIVLGQTATLTISVTGTPVPTLQWFKNGTAIAGAMSAALTFTNVQSSDAGAYTCVATNSAGIVTSSAANVVVGLPSRLTNLSVNTNITAASPNFTVGTVISGSGPIPLVVRADGPSLGALGVPGVIGDPQLILFNSAQAPIASNDNWGAPVGAGAASAATLLNAMASVGAFAFTGSSSLDAAIYQPSLSPGGYTVQVSGVNNSIGTALAEIYDATPAGAYTPTGPRLVNVSVSQVIPAGGALTLGFTVGGATPKTVLIRVIGPGLAAVGVNSGTLGDPQLTLFDSSNHVVATNDDWGATPQLLDAISRVGSFSIGSTPTKDAMLLITLPVPPPQGAGYTARATGNNGTSGFAIVEVYEEP